jgi:predicted N-acetyltransferase YhbS
MPTIEYRQNAPLNATDVAVLFDDSGIRRPTHDLPRIERMFVNANLVFSAWDDGKLVGVCRALTDFSYCCYLSDLAVTKAYQKHGIGRELITRVQAAIGEEVALILLSAPEAMDYYPKVGFEKVENGFIIKRSR